MKTTFVAMCAVLLALTVTGSPSATEPNEILVAMASSRSICGGNTGRPCPAEVPVAAPPVAASPVIPAPKPSLTPTPAPTPAPAPTPVTAAPSPPPSSYSLALPSGSAVPAGGNISVSWIAPSGSGANDWIGLYPVGSSNAVANIQSYTYTNGTPSGTFTAVAPALAGAYEFRYLLNNGYRDVSRSTAITVSSIVPTSTASPTTAAPTMAVPTTAAPTPTAVAAPLQTSAPAASPVSVAIPAELPRVTFNTSVIPVRTGRLINVPADYATIQAAVNAAAPGDEIAVQPTYRETGTYGGPPVLTLPYKGNNTAWIWIHTAALSSLPPRGTRIDGDTHAQYMPKVVSPGGPTPAMNVANKANHYWITGLEFKSVNPSPQPITQLVAVGYGASQPSDLPSYIVFDRDYFHGELNTAIVVRGGLMILGNYVSVEDSVIRWIWAGSHAQALWIAQGTGIRVHNDYLDASSQNLFIGATWGGTNAIPDLAQDITVTHTHIRKDPAFLNDPKWAGTAIYSTLFEMKSGLRVLLEGNILENTATQPTYHADWAVILKSENNNASTINPADYTQVKAETSDITLRYNIIRHVGTGILSGTSSNMGTTATLAKRHTFSHNLFYDLNNPGGTNATLVDGAGNGSWYGIMLLPMTDFLFAHNTVILGKDVTSEPSRGMHIFYTQANTQFSDNIFPLMKYGFAADNGTSIIGGLNTIFNAARGAIPGAHADHNLIYAMQSSVTSALWPDPVSFTPTHGNLYELHTDMNVGYVNPAAAPGGYALASGGGKNSASDGTDRGVDIPTVVAKTAGVEAGVSP
jgi:hypothetical protein